MEIEAVMYLIGLGAMVIIMVQVVKYIMNYQKKIVETLANQSSDLTNLPADTKSSGEKLADQLLISKYRVEYEDTIIALEKITKLAQLSETINNASLIAKDPVSKESITAINNINSLNEFITSLNTCMTTVDKN